MIPKVIHYCWFGRGPLNAKAKMCIKSWKKKLPDYKIKLWNEDNFDIESVPYVSQAYHARKFAFVADYVRLYALYTEGGVYMDSDVEVIKRIDEFLVHPAFTGYESDIGPLTGIMASEKGGAWVKDLLDAYKDRDFVRPDGSLNLTTNVEYTAELLKQKGFAINGKKIDAPGYLTVYEQEWFCPKSWNSATYEITNNTYTVHHYAASWWTPRERRIHFVKLHYGEKAAHFLENVYSIAHKIRKIFVCDY